MVDIVIPADRSILPDLPPFNAMKIRAIKVVISLQQGQFPDSQGSNTKIIYSCSLPNYLDVFAQIQFFPAYMGNTAVVNIYGMTDDDCFAATKYNVDPLYQPWYNQITLSAGYITPPIQADGSYAQADVVAAIDDLPIVFQGDVLSAFPDFNDPDRPFVISAVAAFQASNLMMESTSINNQTTLSNAIKSMINTWNNTPNIQYRYNLNTITDDINVTNGHFVGSFMQQLSKICQNYGYQYRQVFDTTNPEIRQLYISRTGATPANTEVSVLGRTTGMIGYPVAIPLGIVVKEYFNPTRNINDPIFLSTYVKPVNGQILNVWQIQAEISTRGEQWESVITLLNALNFGGQ